MRLFQDNLLRLGNILLVCNSPIDIIIVCPKLIYPNLNYPNISLSDKCDITSDIRW